jgi:hypothetical protein
MGILSKIFPFYDAIDQVIRAGRGVVEEDQKRRTLRTEAELKIQIQTEVKKRISEIEEMEKESQHRRDVDKLFKEKEAEDLINQREHDRQLAFEQHRVELFERIKRVEVEIHQQIMAFDIDKQKEIRVWQRDFIKQLEDEGEQVLTDRLPRMLAAAEPFAEQKNIHDQYISRIFKVVDNITESIMSDQEHFRDALKELALRPGKLTDSLIEMNKKLVFNSETKKLVESK